MLKKNERYAVEMRAGTGVICKNTRVEYVNKGPVCGIICQFSDIMPRADGQKQVRQNCATVIPLSQPGSTVGTRLNSQDKSIRNLSPLEPQNSSPVLIPTK